LSRSLIGSSRSIANALLTPRQASHNSTVDHHATATSRHTSSAPPTVDLKHLPIPASTDEFSARTRLRAVTGSRRSPGSASWSGLCHRP
jgi:hypothetical protein